MKTYFPERFYLYYQNTWMSFKLFYSSSNRIFQITWDSVCDVGVFRNILRFDCIRKEIFCNFSIIFQNFFFFNEFYNFSKGAFHCEKWFYYFSKSLVIGYNRCIKIVKEIFFLFYKAWCNNFFCLLLPFSDSLVFFLKIYFFKLRPSHNCFSQGFSYILRMICP